MPNHIVSDLNSAEDLINSFDGTVESPPIKFEDEQPPHQAVINRSITLGYSKLNHLTPVQKFFRKDQSESPREFRPPTPDMPGEDSNLHIPDASAFLSSLKEPKGL